MIHRSDLGEYENLFLIFERDLDNAQLEDVIFSLSPEEAMQMTQCGLLGSFWESTKQALKKSVASLFLNCLRLKKLKNAEESAFYASRFKKTMDRTFRKGKMIDEIYTAIEKQFGGSTASVLFNKFRDRIDYYYHNDGARPPGSNYDRYNLGFEEDGFDVRRPEYNGEFDHIPDRVIFAGVEIFCGCIIAMIPLPGCPALGSTLAFHGITTIIDHCGSESDRNRMQSRCELKERAVPQLFTRREGECIAKTPLRALDGGGSRFQRGARGI
ncbi:MAG: hypothetical protein KDK48_02875 [Chlamydiia bacterium]|nr:hypothetical protein [Chlamydiia bacterium]